METLGKFNPYKDYNPIDRIAFLRSDADYYLAQAQAYRSLAMRAVDEINRISKLMKGDGKNA